MAERVTGHIHLREGRRGPVWYARYRLADGRQAQKRLGPAWEKKGKPEAGHLTERMANDRLQELLTDARRGELPDSRRSGRTFGDAAAEWLRYVEQEKRRAPSTLSDYTNVVRTTLLPEFGAETPIEKVDVERVNGYRERLLAECRLSHRTIQKQLVIVYMILKRAKVRGWIPSNPAENVERVTVKRSGDFNVLSPVEVQAVARAAASGQDAAIFTVAAFTGLRLGELRALRWQDVEFQKQTIIVRRSFTHGQEGPPKSGKIRSVPLIDQAAAPLDVLSRREQFTASGDLVFCTALGEHINDDLLRGRFYVALEAAGLADKRAGGNPMTFHDLRHTFGTLAVQAWPVTDVQAYLGHANIQTTMIYVHFQPKTAAADKLRDLVAADIAGTAGGTLSPTLSRTAEIQGNSA